LVLILAGEADPPAQAVRDELERRGGECALLGADWATAARLAWSPDPFGGSVTLGGRQLDLTELTGVVARWELVMPRFDKLEPGGDDLYAYSELSATTLGLLDALPCPVVNRPRPGGLGRGMLLGTGPAQAAGMQAVPTVVTSSREEALAAAAPDGETTLVGRVAHRLDDRRCTDPAATGAAVDALIEHGAVVVRRLPPGDPVLAYLAGDAVIGATAAQNGGLRETCDIDDIAAAAVRAIGRHLDLQLVGISFARGTDGRLWLVDVDALPLLGDGGPDLQAAVAAGLADLLTGEVTR
jgi:hypothetical protein